jgi:hypothetical protein
VTAASVTLSQDDDRISLDEGCTPSALTGKQSRLDTGFSMAFDKKLDEQLGDWRYGDEMGELSCAMDQVQVRYSAQSCMDPAGMLVTDVTAEGRTSAAILADLHLTASVAKPVPTSSYRARSRTWIKVLDAATIQVASEKNELSKSDTSDARDKFLLNYSLKRASNCRYQLAK